MDEPEPSIQLVDSDLFLALVRPQRQVHARQSWHELRVCGLQLGDLPQGVVVEVFVREVDHADHAVEVGDGEARHDGSAEDECICIFEY